MAFLQPNWYNQLVEAIAIEQLQQQAASAAKTPDPQCFEMGGEACFGCGACSNTLKMPVAQPKKSRIEWIEIVTPDGSEYIDAHQQWQADTVDMPHNCIAD